MIVTINEEEFYAEFIETVAGISTEISKNISLQKAVEHSVTKATRTTGDKERFATENGVCHNFPSFLARNFNLQAKYSKKYAVFWLICARCKLTQPC